MADNFEIRMDEYLPLRDVVFNTLRQAILKGELKPGERLMEIQLANKLGVSRTPVREAIRKLELEGLVLMIPRKGAEVAEITRQDMEDVLEVRTALEELAVKDACDHITDAQLSELKKASNEFKKALLEGKDLVTCADADMHFHNVILSATNNRRLIQMLNNLSEQMYRYRVEYLKDDGIYPRLIEEHQKMYDALKAKDQELAVSYVEKHLHNQAEAVKKIIREQE